jgi:hypothetical protein
MSPCQIFIDGHVHLYPNFDIALAIKTGLYNMKSAYGEEAGSKEIVHIWLLTERNDCNFFRQIRKSSVLLIDNDMKIEAATDSQSLQVRNKKAAAPMLYILPGSQIVSRDGLEVCALTIDAVIPDRRDSTEEIIDQVIAGSGIPALNWAPGKWFFSRGKIVRRIIETNRTKSLLIGDTSMRPAFWPTPGLMKRAREYGYKIIAGSDPLPFHGEEANIGTYGFKLEGYFDPEKPTESVRTLLLNPQTKVELFGRRSDSLKFIKRQYKIMGEKKNRL